MVHTLTGNVIKLEVKPLDTIGNVKVKISDRLGIPTEDQILLYKDMPLQDSHTLHHYHIPDEGKLHLRLRLRG